MKRYLLPSLLFFVCQNAISQNIGINSTGANPDASAMLDIVSTSQGILVPRVALTATNVAGPITAPATSLLVYNTVSAGAGATAVTPGYYFNAGTPGAPNWNRFDTGNTVGDWKILGNGNTTSGTNFIGTTNGQALDFRTNNTLRFRVANGNQVHAMSSGTSGAPFYSWDVDTDIGLYRIGANDIGVSTGGVERVSISNAATIFNETSTDTDLRIESNGNANMFYLDAGTNRVSIGTNLSGGTFNVLGNSYFSDDINLRDGAVNGGDILVSIYDSGDDGVIDVYQNNAYNHRIHGNSATIFNEQGLSLDFRVEGNTNQNLFFLDASVDRIGVGGTNTNGILEVQGNFAPALGSIGVGVAINSNASGIGINGAGQGAAYNGLVLGSGAAFSGNTTGIYSYTTTGGVGQGMLIQDAFGAQWNVGYWDGGAYRKIAGTGNVNTVVEDVSGNKVMLSCPEAPEALYFDYGIGKLNNGFAHIEIDPSLVKNIVVNEAHPLKVFIQLEGECKGVYVTNKSKNGFDVVELQAGKSNVEFSYKIVATMGDQILVDEEGNHRVAKYDERWPAAPVLEENLINQNKKKE